MGFALWIDQDTVWAQGTHEYRPMGVAVVAISDLLTARDFRRARRPPSRLDETFVGLFASIGEMNEHLLLRRSGRWRMRSRRPDRLTRRFL